MTAEEIRTVLEHALPAIAIEHVRGASSAGGKEPLDWANELEEEDREEARAVARNIANIIASRLGVPLL